MPFALLIIVYFFAYSHLHYSHPLGPTPASFTVHTLLRTTKYNEDFGLVQTTQLKNESAAFFLRLGLRSTLILCENGAFRKRSSYRRDLKAGAFRFHVNRNVLKTVIFENALQTRGICKHGLFVLGWREKKFEKTELFNNNGVKIIKLFP